MKNKKQYIHANGKLLLSSEYFVLDGALALALPTLKGQTFTFDNNSNSNVILWKSFDEKKELWFEGIFSLKNFKAIETSDISISNRLTQILTTCYELNNSFLKNKKGIAVESHLTFPKNWGLGTSSTLIYSIATWAKVDAFLLLEKTFGGSGYDIACAGADNNILYSKKNGVADWANCSFKPTFKNQLFFIFLGQKQNSREGISYYREMEIKDSLILQFSSLTKKILLCKDFSKFEKLIDQHEDLVSSALHLQKVKDLHFKDYWGSVKSLGAWGGDFVLVTSNRPEEETRNYFNEKGLEVFLRYDEIIIK
ncbi:MAG: GYDIA family GHMP kinase [Saprospiraceae bacterium]|nr:GYDIA family GHMP kinase [Saprospiraceae bacterium]